MSRNLSMYSTQRLRSVFEFVTENDNGDADLPALVADIDAEIERRERIETLRRHERMVADYVSEGLGE